MIHGLYQSAAGMLTQMENHQVIAENIASANIPGFRRSQTSFESYLSPVADKGPDPILTDAHPGIQLWPPNGPQTRVTTDFRPGNIQADGNSRHVALAGPGFFAVEMPDNRGVGYTRNGLFSIDSRGQMITSDGWPVLDENGVAVSVPNPTLPIRINDQGEVFQQGQVVGKLRLVNFADPQKTLHWAGGTYFQPNDPQAPVEPVTVSESRLMQGYVENSNVNPIQEMVSLIQATRAYEANQKALQNQDSTLEQVIRQVPNR